MTERLFREKKFTATLPGVKITKTLESEVVAYCKDHKISMSEAVRQGLELLLGRVAQVAPLRSPGGTSA